MDRLATVGEREALKRKGFGNLLSAALCACALAALLAPQPCYGIQNDCDQPAAFPRSTLRGTSAILDLDGDQRADFASAEPEWAPAGPNRYRVDVRLTRAPAATFYVDTGWAEGLRIIARDIDGDDDLDLLVTTRFERLLAVWINDGHGQFTEGALSAALQPVWHKAATNLETHAARFNAPVFVCPGNAGIVKPAPGGMRSDFQGSTLSEQTECRAASVWNTGNSLRAPPLR